MPLPVLAAIAVTSTVISAYGSIQESEARAEQARREAALKRMQADEVLDRAEINAGLMDRQGKRLISSQVASFGASNVSLGASQYGLLSETERNVDEQIQLMRRDAEFRAKMLREGASSADVLAGQIQSAGYWSAAGTLLGGGSKAFYASGAFDKKPKTPTIDGA